MWSSKGELHGMSNCRDAGNAADVAAETKQSKCEDGKPHNWKQHGSWPSLWEECTKCGETLFWK